MHELAVCQSLIDQVSSIAAEQHAQRVEKIHVQVGPLAGVEPDLLQAAFPMARINTAASSAELVISTSPVVVLCPECGEESEVTINNMLCAICGNWETQLISGDELILQRVELHTEH